MADDPTPVLPPSNPVMPDLGQPSMPQYTGNQDDLLQNSLLNASQLGQSAFTQQLQRMRDLATQVQQLQQQKAAQPMPKMGLSDEPWMKMQPVTGQGFGGDLGNLFKDIGRGLLTGVAATGPGQQVQGEVYGPGVARYGKQQQAMAERIAELQGQEKTEEEPLASAGALQYRPYMAAAAGTRAAAAKQNAETNAKRQAMQESQGLERLAQGWDRLSLGQQQQKTREWYDQAVIRVMGQRVEAGMDENSARIQAQEDVKAALSENQFATTHPVLNWLGLGPDIKAAPGAQKPKSAEGPKSSGSKGGVVYARDPQGKLHSAPAGTALPKGWKAEKR